MNFTLDNLDAAKTAYERLKRKVIELKKEEHKGNDESKKYEEEFLSAVNDDLNIPLAVQVTLKLLDDFYFDSKKKLKLLEKFDEVLGLGIKDMKEDKLDIPNEVNKLLKDRENARKNKDWEESDNIREEIKKLGFAVEDKPDLSSEQKVFYGSVNSFISALCSIIFSFGEVC